MNAATEPIAAAPTQRGRMIFGSTVFVVGQLAPLAVALVIPIGMWTGRMAKRAETAVDRGK